jgi:hypothetical protein
MKYYEYVYLQAELLLTLKETLIFIQYFFLIWLVIQYYTILQILLNF